MQWSTTHTDASSVTDAVADLASGIEADLEGSAVHLVMLFVAPQWHNALPSLVAELRRRVGGAPVIGCSGAGLAANEHELEPATGVVAMAAHLPDVGVVPFSISGLEASERTAEQWRSELDLIPEQQPVFIVLPEPFSVDIQPLMDVLDAAFPGCPKLGGLASGGRTPGSHRLICGDDVFASGVVGVALFGDVRLVPVVAQAARPVGPVMEVTAATGQAIQELDGKPVVQVLETLFASLSQEDRRSFQSSAAVGLAPASDQGESLRVGDFLIRDLLGFNRTEGSLMVAARVGVGDRLQLQVRDAASADQELRELLDRVARHPGTAEPAAALMFSCLGRGARFFGLPHHDVSLVRSKLGSPSIGGFFCNGELGPVRGRTWTHGYTCALALMYPRGWS
ncbi:MAG TPA: hypothetical protein DFR83_12460 [Deltaproteobacteria bacterium]|nr:hypothetical protein [Deltaproteobacteria bacterium]